MWNWVYLIPLVAIVMGVGIPIAVIINLYLLKMKRAEIIRTAIEKGEEIPPELLALMENEKSDEARKHEKEMALIEQGLYEPYQRRRSLRSGIIVSSLGVAFTVYSIVTSRGFTIAPFPDAEGGSILLLAGLILLFLGAGLITYHYLAESKAITPEHNSADEG